MPVAPPGRFVGSSYGIPGDCCILSVGERFDEPGAEYELPLFRWGSIVPSFDWSYKSRTFLDPQQELLISQAPYWILGARIAYRTPGGGIEVAAWVQNLLDERYKIDAFDQSRQFGQVNEIWAEPRTFGLTVSFAF